MAVAQTKFSFNPKAADNNPYIKELEKERDKLKATVDDLLARATVGGIPMLHSIINALPPDTDLSDVRKVGKALTKWADIQPRLRQLNKQLGVIDVVKRDPDLIILAFGDEDDLSSGISDSFETLLETPEAKEYYHEV